MTLLVQDIPFSRCFDKGGSRLLWGALSFKAFQNTAPGLKVLWAALRVIWPMLEKDFRRLGRITHEPPRCAVAAGEHGNRFFPRSDRHVHQRQYARRVA